MKVRRILIAIAVTGLAGALAAPALAQSVIQGVTVRVNAGQMDTYMERVGTLDGMTDRLGVSGDIEVWQAVAGGANAGSTLVAVEYPNLAAWADATTKLQADAEYNQMIAGLGDLRSLEAVNVWEQVGGAAREGDVATGTILQAVMVRVNPGQLANYVAKVGELEKISDGLGLDMTTRIWQARVAGQAAGNVVVGILHKDLNAYAANTTKLQASEDWQKLIAGLDDIRTIVSTGLSRNVGP